MKVYRAVDSNSKFISIRDCLQFCFYVHHPNRDPAGSYTEYVMQDLMYTHSVLYSYIVVWRESCMGGIKSIAKVVTEGEVYLHDYSHLQTSI